MNTGHHFIPYVTFLVSEQRKLRTENQKQKNSSYCTLSKLLQQAFFVQLQSIYPKKQFRNKHFDEIPNRFLLRHMPKRLDDSAPKMLLKNLSNVKINQYTAKIQSVTYCINNTVTQ